MNALADFNCRYSGKDAGSIRLYIDKAENPDLDTEMTEEVLAAGVKIMMLSNEWGNRL